MQSELPEVSYSPATGVAAQHCKTQSIHPVLHEVWALSETHAYTAIRTLQNARVVPQMMVMVAIRKETPEGNIQTLTREFGTFRKDRELMYQFLQQHQIDLVIMESTGVYWKSIYASIIGCNLNPWVVNARHVKNVPGRKTDVLDSQ